MDEQTRRLDLPGILRALRRRADLSQRELAGRAGMAPAQLARIEVGNNSNPGVRTMERLFEAAAARLAVLDLDGTELAPLATDGWLDEAGRRYPPHLDPHRLTPLRRWRGRYRREVITFWRDRWRRDESRRERSGERRWDMFTEIRRLGPRDAAVLEVLRADAAGLDLAGRQVPTARTAADRPTPPDKPTAPDAAALRYLRDPNLRHWIAEHGKRILGHLIAYVHRRYTGPPVLIVTQVGVRPEARSGMVGPLLAAAVADEAVRLGVDEIWALADHRAVADYLRELGFRRAPKGSRLLAG